MACRRSQVRSLSGPPFETIRTRRKAGFLFVVGAGAFRSVKSAGGRFAVRVRAAIKKRRKAGFFVCVLLRRVQARFGARGGVFLRGVAVLGARRWQVRFAPLKAGKVCAPVISP